MLGFKDMMRFVDDDQSWPAHVGCEAVEVVAEELGSRADDVPSARGERVH